MRPSDAKCFLADWESSEINRDQDCRWGHNYFCRYYTKRAHFPVGPNYQSKPIGFTAANTMLDIYGRRHEALIKEIPENERTLKFLELIVLFLLDRFMVI